MSEPSGDEEDLQLLSPEERERRRKFEQKRKAHYNEFYAVKMARQLMEDDADEEGPPAKEASSSSSLDQADDGAAPRGSQADDVGIQGSSDPPAGPSHEGPMDTTTATTTGVSGDENA